jgi:hypothetical protein
MLNKAELKTPHFGAFFVLYIYYVRSSASLRQLGSRDLIHISDFGDLSTAIEVAYFALLNLNQPIDSKIRSSRCLREKLMAHSISAK